MDKTQFELIVNENTGSLTQMRAILTAAEKYYSSQNSGNAIVSGSDSLIPEQQQIAEWKTKAEKWEALGKEIEKFYCNSDGDYDEENPEEDGDLGSIGEVAAVAYGWL
jgi:hypothetical protein